LLIGFLDHPERSVRAYSLLALGEIGVHSAREMIEALLDDKDEDVRVRAAEALLALAREERTAGP
jgi:HEAT repeat protein